jgi:hypothetical protein
MTASVLRPRTVTEIVDAAFQLLRRRYLALVTAGAVVLMPAIVLELVLPKDALALANLVSNLLLTMFDAVVIYIVSESYLGRPADVGAALRAAGERSGSLLGAAFLRGLLVGVGLLLLVVPGLVLLAHTFAIPMVILLEGSSAGESFGRARELARGNVWRILGTLALGFVIVIVGVAALGFALGMLVTLVGSPERLTNALGEVAMIFVYPIGGVVATLLYFDLRIRKEGFDLEVMAGELDAGAASAAQPASPDLAR